MAENTENVKINNTDKANQGKCHIIYGRRIASQYMKEYKAYAKGFNPGEDTEKWFNVHFKTISGAEKKAKETAEKYGCTIKKIDLDCQEGQC